jgi:large repetitive protein
MKKTLHYVLTALILLLMPIVTLSQIAPDLGVASTFVLFTSSGAVTNVGISQITGNVGSNSGPVTGFGNVNGQMHSGDGVTGQAAFDLNIAYNNIASQAATVFPGIALGGGQVLTPAVFGVPAPSVLSGILTLDGLGDPDACFIFQMNGAFSADPGASIALINGTKACNVFWKVEGAVTLATGVDFKGNLIVNGAITLTSGDDLEGRALSMVGAIGVTSVTASTPIGCGSPTLMGPLAPPLGSTECFALFTSIGAMTNTGITHIDGDIGTNNGPLTGFDPLLVNGTIHTPPDGATAQAALDIIPLYTALNVLPCDIELLYPAQFGNSQVLTPHVYCMNTAAHLTDTIFLDAQGSPDAVFVIQINGALTTSTYSNVVLRGGTQSKNVYWKVEGAADISAYSIFRGTLVTNNGAITMAYGDTLDGRALSTNGAVTIHDGNISLPDIAGIPIITPDGPLTFCEGDSVVLTASSGSSYLWSTGQTTQSITVFNSGDFTVTTTGSCGGGGTSAVTTVTVYPLPIAIITPNGPINLCQGESVMLTSSPAESYLWSNGAITQSITVNTSGDYSVTVTDINGCSATSPITVVTVNPLPIATITPDGPTEFCEGESVLLTASPGDSYLWSNGQITQSILVTNAGNYTVTVTNTFNCSATSAITVVTVYPLPIAIITPSGPTSFCQGESVILTSSPALSYLWSNGAITQSITVTMSGNYSVTVSDINGCSATSPITIVTVNPLPIATITPDGPTEFCEGESVTLTSSPGDSYLWSNGQTTQSILVTNSGNYSVTVTSSFNCSATSAITEVIVNPLPIAIITPSGPTTFCQGESVILTSSPAVTYLWSNGAITQSIIVSMSGNYSVTVTDINGCSATSPITIVTVNPLPIVTITPDGPTEFCQGESVLLTSSPGETYLWSNGQTTQSILVTNAGSYSVTMTDINGCSGTSPITIVTVYPLPIAIITPLGPTEFCEGGSVTLLSSPAILYAWSNGGNTQAISVQTSGVYTVTVTDINGCSATSEPITITVYPSPIATITPNGPTDFCQGESVMLTSSPGESYLWSTGQTTQSIMVNTSGVYTVTVTNSFGCSETSQPTVVTVHPLPIVVVTPNGPTSFCQGESVVLTSSMATTYLWSNGQITQSITVSTSGNYFVTVTDEFGCSATSDPITVTVYALPLAEITASGPLTFCEGGSVTLTSSPASIYLWSNGQTTQSILVENSGDYFVTVTDIHGCSATSAITVVNVLPVPEAIITPNGPLAFCEGGSVLLTASEGTSYLWSTGATTQSILVTNSGDYFVTVSNGFNCSATSLITTVTVYPLPDAIITANGPLEFCEGSSVTLTSSPAVTYLWSNGQTTQSILVENSGDYFVTVTDMNGCSATSAITTVNVLPVPDAIITPNGPLTFCDGESVTLTSSPGLLYLWSTGETTQSIVVTTSGVYFVTVSNGDNCSATSASVTVVVNPLPLANISPEGPVTICQGSSVTLTSSSGESYVWSTGETTQSIVVETSGDYFVTVTNIYNCSATSQPTTIMVDPLPIAGFTSSETGSLTYSFVNTSVNATSFVWDFGDGQTSTSVDPTNIYAAAGTYTVTLTATNGCGSDTATAVITLTPILEFEFFNGYSPNGDGYNDYWKIPMLSYYTDNEVLIINRWGNEVWKGVNYNNESVKWEGKNMDGDEMPDGTYYYIINYNNIVKTGWVFIKR